MATLRETIQEITNKMKAEFPSENPQRHAEVLLNFFEKGIMPFESMGFDNRFVGMLYSYAYKLFQSGKFSDAEQVYRLLMCLNPLDARYPHALAATLHKEKKFQESLNNYIVAAYLAPDDPMPLYHASDCCMQMNDPYSALTMLSMVIDRVGERKEFNLLKQRAELSINSLTQQFKDTKG